MSDTYRKVLIIAGLVFCSFSSVFAYSGGSGTEINPYQIASKVDLLVLAGTPADCNKCFILTADIDMEGQVFTTAIIAPDTSPDTAFQGTPFAGTFDGNNHRIMNFTINGESNTHLGLFGCIISGSVKNLGLEDFTVSGSSVTASLLGENDLGIIENCFATGSVSGGSVAGLVGKNYGGTIKNCSFSGYVSGSSMRVGGLVGYNSSGIIKNCFSAVSVSVSGSPYVSGGLVGENYGGTIEGSFSMGSVSSSSGTVGGLVGHNSNNSLSDGTIKNSFSTASVSSSSYAGGLVGDNEQHYSYQSKTVIENCFATGSVNGSSYIGGLVGNNRGGIGNCYSTGSVSGSSEYIGGLVGFGGNIHNCYSNSSVSGSSNSEYIGGLVGSGNGISNCYSTGSVSGSSGSRYIGGLIGEGDFVSNCYSTGVLSGDIDVGGLVGKGWQGISLAACFWDVNSSGLTDGVGNIDPDPAGVTGKTTTEMQNINTFLNAGWDFDYTDGDEADWFIQINEYPILVWQISPADIYTDGRNNFRDFTVFAQYWMRDDCAIYNNYCDWADLDFNGSVDIDDLVVLMSYWLKSGVYE